MTACAPDQTAWWDVAAITDRVLVVLGLAPDDPLVDVVDDLIPAAGNRINDYLDRPASDPITDPVPAVLEDSLVQVTVELYRRKDAPPSSVEGLLGATWRPPSIDPLAGVRAAITPYKRRWGFG